MCQQWSVVALQEMCDPFLSTVWAGVRSPITREEVREAIEQGELLNEPWGTREWGRTQHIQRVAWLVVHGWTDAICVDVGVPSLNCYVEWIVEDGNHRLAAAIYKEERSILVSPAGDMELYLEFQLHA